MAEPGKIEVQIMSLSAKANGVMLEDSYEAEALTGSCRALRDELSKIPDSDREAALINMAAVNLVRHKTNPNVPAIELVSLNGGNTQFKFTACDSKTSFSKK